MKETEKLVSILGEEVVEEFPWKNGMKPSTNDNVEEGSFEELGDQLYLLLVQMVFHQLLMQEMCYAHILLYNFLCEYRLWLMRKKLEMQSRKWVERNLANRGNKYPCSISEGGTACRNYASLFCKKTY